MKLAALVIHSNEATGEEHRCAVAVIGDHQVNGQELALGFGVEVLAADGGGPLADAGDGDVPVLDREAVSDAEAFAAVGLFGLFVSGWLFGLILSVIVLRGGLMARPRTALC